MSDVEDKQLVERCLKGEPLAFDALVERYQRPLYRLAYRMAGNPEDALDLTQSAFLKAYQNLDSYRPGSKFFSWIYRIAVNEGINHGQHHRAQQRMRQGLRDGVSEPPSIGPPERSRGSRDWVQPALLELTLEYRIVIVLRHFLDLSYRQMAEVLGVPEKTVKSRLFSARRLLREFVVESASEVMRPAP